eukprot:scaffold107569_cov18-Prasinocladus_malaysianus.AAC.1
MMIYSSVYGIMNALAVGRRRSNVANTTPCPARTTGHGVVLGGRSRVLVRILLRVPMVAP